MSSLSVEPEMLALRLSHRPSYLLRGMITVDSPPRPQPRPQHLSRDGRVRADRVSSLGALDHLPPELLSILLGMLDSRSIACFARVSTRGNALVQSHRAYRDLVSVAPRVLVALGRVRLIGLHSVAELHAGLRMERCAYCAEYGAFLFLPTCERCCWECLRRVPSLRMISPKEAKRYFGLSDRHLRQLPTLYVIPGTYGISADAAPGQCRLVSVKAARALGLAVHGSVEKLAEAMARRVKSTRLLVTGRYLQAEPAGPEGQDSLMLPDQGNVPNDSFFGMASIPFPSLSNSGTIEEGLWCRGCQDVLRQYNSLRSRQDVLAAIVPPNLCSLRVLVGLERRARSKESFLDHVRHCYGAKQLVPQLAVDNDGN
ncbi:F-box domain-containing protein [Xylariomycetidae sp. FL2044]|nr:F-box domain-containing protein [Xylariomycetidae sp. FL2044]